MLTNKKRKTVSFKEDHWYMKHILDIEKTLNRGLPEAYIFVTSLSDRIKEDLGPGYVNTYPDGEVKCHYADYSDGYLTQSIVESDPPRYWGLRCLIYQIQLGFMRVINRIKPPIHPYVLISIPNIEKYETTVYAFNPITFNKSSIKDAHEIEPDYKKSDVYEVEFDKILTELQTSKEFYSSDHSNIEYKHTGKFIGGGSYGKCYLENLGYVFKEMRNIIESKVELEICEALKGQKMSNVVNILDVYKNGIMMQYCNDSNLGFKLHDPNMRNLIHKIISQVVNGVLELKSCGLQLHGDLASRNIFFNDGVVKIGDFGLGSFNQQTSIKRVGNVSAAQEKEWDSKADVFSCGYLVLEMLFRYPRPINLQKIPIKQLVKEHPEWGGNIITLLSNTLCEKLERWSIEELSEYLKINVF